MSVTDPISNYLTILRNGAMVNKETVTIPKNKIKVEISKVLKEEGYINDYKVEEDGPKGSIHVDLKYTADGRNVIREMKRVSKPSCRQYEGKSEIRPFRNGLGMYVLTTPKGVMCDRDARRQGVGGEVLFSIW